VRGVEGVFLWCFAQFRARENEGKKRQNQHFKKEKRVQIEEKNRNLLKKIKIPKNRQGRGLAGKD